MDATVKTKLKFITSLKVKHSKAGTRTVYNRLAMEHFDKLTCRPDDEALYVGCGTGDETAILATRMKSVIGIDFDPSVLEIASRDFPADNLEYILDDLGDSSPNLAKWRGRFSSVVCIGRVLFFPNAMTVVKNAVDCLRPGGELLCIIPNDDFGFFDGGAKVIEDNPDWAGRIKMEKTTLWRHTEKQAREFFQGICKWSKLSCEKQQFDLFLTEEKSKLIWLDAIEYLDPDVALQEDQCLQAIWQWACAQYGLGNNGCLNKPNEVIVVFGVKAA